jgi:integrase/recombinase XerC
VSAPPSKSPGSESGALERYLEGLRTGRRLAAHTLAAYDRDTRLLQSLAEGRDARVLTSHDIRRFIAALHGKGLAPRSLARVLSAWRGFYEWLVRHREAGANPCAGVRPPRAAKRLPAALSPDQAVRLVSIEDDSPLGVRDRALFELAYSSGLRVSELTGIDLGALDAASGELRVTGKGSKTRIVPVGRAALEAIDAWLGVRKTLANPGEAALFVGRSGKRVLPREVQRRIKRRAALAAIAAWLPERARLAKPGEAALFVGRSGRRLAPREVQRRIKRRAAAAGIEVDVHPHMLRHSFASHVLQSSGDLRAVQEMLGHASIASTQVYTHLDFQHLAKVYDAAHPRARRRKG